MRSSPKAAALKANNVLMAPPVDYKHVADCRKSADNIQRSESHLKPKCIKGRFDNAIDMKQLTK